MVELKNIFLLVLLLSSFALVGTFKADTGTYVINKEIAHLIVHNNTDVDINYTITFQVTGGDIPWVTVGLPNSDYTITGFGGAAASASSQNSYSWTGAYVNLDRTYYPGESFTFYLNATEHNFISRYGANASLSFSPVWWDNAVTNNLTVIVTPKVGVINVTTSSQPTRFANGSVIWTWYNVAEGEKETVGVIFPQSAFTFKAGAPTTVKQSASAIPEGIFIAIIITITLLIVIVSVFRSLRKGTYDEPSASFNGGTEITRHLNMNCPNDSTPLEKRDVKGTTIDFCDTCGGCWFDKGEVETLIQNNVSEQDLNTDNKEFLGEINASKSKCPRCDGILRKRTKEDTAIFVCEKCEGIWMDRGNYQKIKDKRSNQEDLQKQTLDNAKTFYPMSWWWYYPYIRSTGPYSQKAINNSSARGSTSSGIGSLGIASSCACVACACVAACACACACAGGGAAGCAPKSKFGQIRLYEKKV